MDVPVSIQPTCKAFIDGLRAVLGDKLHSVYINGAVTFPETKHYGDLDFHVILNDPLTDGEKSDLLDLHKVLARDFPPLGAELDCHYILLEDVRGSSPPEHQLVDGVRDEAWALHREHMRAGRVFILHGPDPVVIFPAPSRPEIDYALQGELNYVRDHLDIHHAYCVMNLCRLMYSYETRDVVTSKAASGVWAREKFPQWVELIDAAVKAYAGEATDQDRELMVSRVHEFYKFACDRINLGLNT